MNELTQSTAAPSAWIDRIFQRLACMYGTKWLDMWKGTDLDSVKSIWREDLAGYSGDEIKRGLDACKTHVFPPTLPEFLTLCRPPVNPESAFTEAVNQIAKRKQGMDKWSHKAIYWAAQSIGSADMMSATWQTIRSRWTTVLAEMMAEHSLPDVPAYAVGLPPPGKTSIEPEVAKSRVADLVKSIKPPTDYKAWAKKLVAQEESGQGRPHRKALELAREALENG